MGSYSRFQFQTDLGSQDPAHREGTSSGKLFFSRLLHEVDETGRKRSNCTTKASRESTQATLVALIVINYLLETSIVCAEEKRKGNEV